MKTIKFRIIEQIKQKGYTSDTQYSLQLKSLFRWNNYTFDNGGMTEVKEFESRKDCLTELFKKSGRSPSHIRLKEYPPMKFIYIDKIK